jgi:hypothetical protein
MQIIVQTKEDYAKLQRRLDPWLPDNIAEDEEARLRYLETGKACYSDIQFTRMACRSAAKRSVEEKRKCWESLFWWLHESKLRTDIVN